MHQAAIDMTGKIIGKWTVLHRCLTNIQTKCRHIVWMCRCECGVELPVDGCDLRNGGSLGCTTCRNKELEKLAVVGHYYYIKASLKHRQRKSELSFDITIDEFENLLIKQNNKCVLSGLYINFAKSRKDRMHGGGTASLDRIESDKHYNIDNVQWLHKDVNRMKMDFTQQKFLELCCLIANNSRIKTDAFKRHYSKNELISISRHYKYCKKSATDGIKRRIIPFEISESEFVHLIEEQNYKCALSGLDIYFQKNARDYSKTASLDRINSAKGYTINNIQWVHKDINKMKMDLQQERFIELCKLITLKNKAV